MMPHNFVPAYSGPVNFLEVWIKFEMLLVANDQRTVRIVQNERVGNGFYRVFELLFALSKTFRGLVPSLDVVIIRHVPDNSFTFPQ